MQLIFEIKGDIMPTLMGSINVIARCARLYRNDMLKKYGIHGTMDVIILRVCKEPGLSQDEIAKLVCIDKSNASRKVAKLVEKGYLRRESSENDKRVQLVYPTQTGLEICEEIRTILCRWSADMTEGLPDEQAQIMLEGLGMILERARKYADEREED